MTQPFATGDAPHFRPSKSQSQALALQLGSLLPAILCNLVLFPKTAIPLWFATLAGFFGLLLVKKRNTTNLIEAALLGTLIFLMLPPNLPPVLGLSAGLFACLAVRWPFGEAYLFHPALAAVAFVALGFPRFFPATGESSSVLLAAIFAGGLFLNFKRKTLLPVLIFLAPLAMMQIMNVPVLLAAFFLLPEPRILPAMFSARLFYALLSVLILLLMSGISAIQPAVCFSLLLSQALVPLMDLVIKPKTKVSR